MSNLAFCKKSVDVHLLTFWRETKLVQLYIKDGHQFREKDPQFKQALVHLVSCMVEAATSDKSTPNVKIEEKLGGAESKEAAKTKETDDLVLAFLEETSMFQGLKQILSLEQDPSMKDEIKVSLKCMNAKMTKFKNQKGENKGKDEAIEEQAVCSKIDTTV